jgi:hypothetical protein
MFGSKRASSPSITSAGGRGIRLFDEGLHRKRRAAVKLGAGPDIAVIGRRERRRDAEGDDQAVGRGSHRFKARAGKGIRVADHVIGGKHDHGRRRIARGGEHRGDADRHGGIAAYRFEHDVTLDGASAHLLGDDETKIRIGDDDRPVEYRLVTDTAEHLLKRRALPDQQHELLGHALARDRPQPRARAAAHDHWYQEMAAHRPLFGFCYRRFLAHNGATVRTQLAIQAVAGCCARASGLR